MSPPDIIPFAIIPGTSRGTAWVGIPRTGPLITARGKGFPPPRLNLMPKRTSPLIANGDNSHVPWPGLMTLEAIPGTDRRDAAERGSDIIGDETTEGGLA